MNTADVLLHLGRDFPFEPTPSQEKAMRILAHFLSSHRERCILVLNGYAGTGKTTLLQAVGQTCDSLRMPVVLMAPTGRAAKVMENYTGRTASTIHRKIYGLRVERGEAHFTLMPNKLKRALFVVDEASMIGDMAGDGFGTQGLLTDLLQYVFSSPENRLLLVGDVAQLPPVHHAYSPALDLDLLRADARNNVAACSLTDVQRQQAETGILEMATHLRLLCAGHETDWVLPGTGKPDVHLITGQTLPEHLEEAFGRYGEAHCLLITRSNKAAYQYNQYVRHRILGREERLQAGDRLMVVRNNYRWLQYDDGTSGLIANGEMCEVQKVIRFEEQYGLAFARCNLKFYDQAHEPEVECVVLLNTLESASPALTRDEWRILREEAQLHYAHLPSEKERREALKTDEYVNALQIKYAYAVTCHKAQGGQWPCIFLDQGYLTEEMLDRNFWRWLYTGITRASEQLFLVNFSKLFTGEETED